MKRDPDPRVFEILTQWPIAIFPLDILSELHWPRALPVTSIDA
jgi:hypothetical protein